MAADDEGDDENSWRPERLLAAAGARGSVVMFSSDAATTSATRHRCVATLPNDSSVVVVARNATGEEVHEALCGVLARVAANDATLRRRAVEHRDPDEDAANPADGGGGGKV